MGVWGSGLYANDSTCDVRDTYIKFLQDGSTDIEAYEKTLKEYEEYIGDQDEPLLWFALAETQWRFGRLMPVVKETALKWIEEKGGIGLWLESKTKGIGWKNTLVKLQQKLKSPMPSRKAIRKPKEIDMNLWEINDIYAYKFHEENAETAVLSGKYIVLQKIGEGYDYTDGLKMRIHVFDKIFNDIPSLENIGDVRLLPLDYPSRFNYIEGVNYGYELRMSKLMCMSTENEYPAEYLTYIGNKKGPLNVPIKRDLYDILSWRHVNSSFAELNSLWRTLNYDCIGDGVYRFTPK